MKLLHFDDFRVGVLRGPRGNEEVVDVTDLLADIPRTGPNDVMRGLIERFDSYRGKLEKAAAEGKGIPLASVRIRPPLPRPGAIVCMAVNYMEDGTLTEKPVINAFQKTPSAVIGQGDTMVLPDVPAHVFEGEAELALVIGKRASNVPAEKAKDYIFGYMNFIDGSARGLPAPNNSFFQVKSRATFAPIGPFLVTADEVPDPQNLRVRLWVNGTVKQDFNTSDMAHDIPRCIEWMSSVQTLEPGDILATGTNHRGLSSLQDGDNVELEVEGMGRLAFRVQDDLKRTWGRDTRLEHKEKGLDGPYTPQLTGKYSKAG